MRLYFKGVPAKLPMWAQAMAAAKGDPLRAMEIEERLSEEWFWRWRAWDEEQARAMEQ